MFEETGKKLLLRFLQGLRINRSKCLVVLVLIVMRLENVIRAVRSVELPLEEVRI